ncbi:MAG: hypothetical protein R3266_12655, partial [Gemmatimonadota bacterium]|nr:hypothetical protein [Gemmatimonadota bacterium]
MDAAFARAVALDPKFAPFHIHLVDLGFARGDSLLASIRLERYGELAPGSLFDRRGRLQFALAYGDAGARGAAAVQLEGLEVEDLHPLAGHYLNACCWHAQEAVLREMRERGDPAASSHATGMLASGALHHGQLELGLELYAEPGVDPMDRACHLSAFYVLGFPIPEERMDEWLAPGALAATVGVEPACRAFYAGQRGRWDRFDRVVDHYRSLETEAGEYAGSPSPGVVLASLRGFELWKRGQTRAALPLVEEAFRAGAFGLWLGQIYQELGRLEEAARFYAAHWATPLAYLELGRVYERLGETAKARKAYETFVSAWDDADPGMRAWVDEAVSGIFRTSDRLEAN